MKRKNMKPRARAVLWWCYCCWYWVVLLLVVAACTKPHTHYAHKLAGFMVRCPGREVVVVYVCWWFVLICCCCCSSKNWWNESGILRFGHLNGYERVEERERWICELKNLHYRRLYVYQALAWTTYIVLNKIAAHFCFVILCACALFRK